MAKTVKHPIAHVNLFGARVVAAQLPAEVADLITKDALAEAQSGERPNESRVLRRIVCQHYAPRLKQSARTLKRAA